MAQDRQSLESQADVIADVLRDTYSDYYRQLQTTLTAQTISPPSTVPASSVNPTPTPAVTHETVVYPAMAPGAYPVVNYALSGLSPSDLQNPSPVLVFAGLALGAYLLSGRK